MISKEDANKELLDFFIEIFKFMDFDNMKEKPEKILHLELGKLHELAKEYEDIFSKAESAALKYSVDDLI